MLTDRRTLMTGAAALAAARPAAAQGSGPIRIGLLHDLSGPFAGAGSVPLSQGAELAIALFNERGGVDGRQVQAVQRRPSAGGGQQMRGKHRLAIAQHRLDPALCHAQPGDLNALPDRHPFGPQRRGHQTGHLRVFP